MDYDGKDGGAASRGDIRWVISRCFVAKCVIEHFGSEEQASIQNARKWLNLLSVFYVIVQCGRETASRCVSSIMAVFHDSKPFRWANHDGASGGYIVAGWVFRGGGAGGTVFTRRRLWSFFLQVPVVPVMLWFLLVHGLSLN